MTACHDQREEFDTRVLDWLEKRSGQWFRVVDIAAAMGASIKAVTSALLRLHARKQVERETRRKNGCRGTRPGNRSGNAKPYPVYRANAWSATGPAWLVPQAPSFKRGEIIGLRVVCRMKDADET